MKLTSIEIHPENSSEVVVLSFRDPGSTNPYNVKSITGLDADEIIPRYYGTSGGSKFYSLSLEKREPVFKIGLNPRFSELETYSDLRDALYKTISSSRTGKIQIKFKNGIEIIAILSGFVSKFETPLFEKTQEVQLTVKCDEPMLKASDRIELNVAALDPANTSILDDKSTAPHGFKFDVDIDTSVASLIISDDASSWAFSIVPASGFIAGDTLYFSSEYNDKYLYIIRGAATLHLADSIAPGSIWPIIFPGTNVFEFTNPTAVEWEHISYYPTYWGV